MAQKAKQTAKQAAKKPRAAAAQKKQMPTHDQIIDAALDMVAQRGIGRVRLSLLAEHFDVSVADIHAIYPDIISIWNGFMDRVDKDMLKGISSGAASNYKKDVYFDLFMTRFDVLQNHRAGVVRWLNDLPKHPDLWLATMQRWNKSLSLMLDVAKDSPLYPVKKAGLAGVYAYVQRAWMSDDTETLDKTMVALDRALQKAGSFTQTFLQRKKA